MKPKKVGLYIKEGWKTSMMFYQFKCPKHGLVIDYPKGYDARLECPLCKNEKLVNKNIYICNINVCKWCGSKDGKWVSIYDWKCNTCGKVTVD